MEELRCFMGGFYVQYAQFNIQLYFLTKKFLCHYKFHFSFSLTGRRNWVLTYNSALKITKLSQPPKSH